LFRRPACPQGAADGALGHGIIGRVRACSKLVQDLVAGIGQEGQVSPRDPAVVHGGQCGGELA